MMGMENKTEFEKLVDIVRALRAPDGCPWDRAQTHASLKPTCVEEAAEVVCGINILEQTGSADNLKEELGDLLLQVVFHAVMAQEEGLFDMDDVIRGISAKMIRRHPHVFGDENGVRQPDPSTIDDAWAKIKQAEKEGREWEQDYLPGALQESKTLIDRAAQRKHIELH